MTYYNGKSDPSEDVALREQSTGYILGVQWYFTLIQMTDLDQSSRTKYIRYAY